MATKITISVEDAVKSLRREFRDLTNDEFNKGVARAMNRVITPAKNAAAREMKDRYNLSVRAFKSAFHVKNASAKNLVAFMMVKHGRLPIMVFNPQQTPSGISVEVVRGQRKNIPASFLALMKSGHMGVYAKGGYRGSDFEFRKNRVVKATKFVSKNGRRIPIAPNDTPIGELTTLGFSTMMRDETFATINKEITERLPNRLMHELKFMRSQTSII